MRKRLMPCSIVAIVGAVALTLGFGPTSEPEFTSDFGLAQAGTLLPNGSNPYFSLRTGSVSRFEGTEDGEFIELEVKVLAQVRPIVFRVDGHWKLAMTRVIREKEWIDGELVEVSHNYFARDPKTNDIFYCGEDVDFYEDGEIVGHDGSWIAGQDGALPGLIMPSRFLLGARYMQEFAPGIAEDQARNAKMGLTITTPAGVFENCIKIVETTPLEPGSQSIKYYAPGVGLIVDSAVKLVSHDD